MAKLLKLRRGTTSQHNTFTGAEGEVTIDTTKDTAVVHDGSTAGGRPLAREDMSNVSSASIASRLGADAIAVTKIAGGTLPSDVKITDANVSGNLTIANADINADAVNGSKIADDSINSEHYVDGSIDAAHLATDSVTSSKLVNLNVTRAKIANDAINADKIADDSINSEHYVDGSIDRAHLANDIVDTTKLINFPTQTILGRETAGTGNATTLSASQVRGIINVENGATADQTSTEIKSLLASDNLTSSHLAANSVGTSEIANGAVTTSKLGSNAVDFANMQVIATNRILARTSSGNGNIEALTPDQIRNLLGVENGATADQTASEILTLIKTVDGSGSGLDADSLDGLGSPAFLRANAGDEATGDITFSGGAGAVTVASASDIRLAGGTWTGEYSSGIKIQPDPTNSYFQYQGTLYFRRGSDGSNRLTIDSTGNLVAQGNVTAYSDAKLKTNVNTINDALSIVGKLRGVSFDWKENGERSIGVIAQEVEEVLPELVLTNQDVNPVTQEIEEIKSVDYGKIVGVLINAINELKEEVEELKNAKITG